ncbi:hypothetical protein CUMW_045530 [Citrus unshiu]|nr:hypothetical protein CUMW_045530 [Citrus unshiu]
MELIESTAFIGHLHLLAKPVHRILHQIPEKYGDILFLRLGNRKVLLVSSPSAAEECFTRNDIIFAAKTSELQLLHNRTCILSGAAQI